MFPTCPTPSLKKNIYLKGLPNKKCSCMRCHWRHMHDFCVRKSIISRRIRSRIQKGFTPWIRAQGLLFDEKTEGRKSRDTVPLRAVIRSYSKILMWKSCYRGKISWICVLIIFLQLWFTSWSMQNFIYSWHRLPFACGFMDFSGNTFIGSRRVNK
jgi:hypothetical protein